MRILVIGKAGFIGSHLVDKLMENEKNKVWPALFVSYKYKWFRFVYIQSRIWTLITIKHIVAQYAIKL